MIKGRKFVYIIEDDPGLAHANIETFKTKGCIVKLDYDYTSAANRLQYFLSKKYEIDIAIVDSTIGEASGMEIVEYIRDNFKNSKVYTYSKYGLADSNFSNCKVIPIAPDLVTPDLIAPDLVTPDLTAPDLVGPPSPTITTSNRWLEYLKEQKATIKKKNSEINIREYHKKRILREVDNARRESYKRSLVEKKLIPLLEEIHISDSKCHRKELWKEIFFLRKSFKITESISTLRARLRAWRKADLAEQEAITNAKLLEAANAKD
jgi:hypothetical protein